MSFSFAKLIDFFRTFFTNPIVLSSFTSWFVSQFFKAIVPIINFRKNGIKDILEALLWRTGGMPSSHAAVVTSMTASVAFCEGIGTNLFAVSLVMALLVMRDAMGVRLAVGVQAKALNLLGKQTSEKLGLDFVPLKEIRGHAPLEVIAGAFLGFFIAIAYVWL